MKTNTGMAEFVIASNFVSSMLSNEKYSTSLMCQSVWMLNGLLCQLGAMALSTYLHWIHYVINAKSRLTSISNHIINHLNSTYKITPMSSPSLYITPQYETDAPRYNPSNIWEMDDVLSSHCTQGSQSQQCIAKHWWRLCKFLGKMPNNARYSLQI